MARCIGRYREKGSHILSFPTLHFLYIMRFPNSPSSFELFMSKNDQISSAKDVLFFYFPIRKNLQLPSYNSNCCRFWIFFPFPNEELSRREYSSTPENKSEHFGLKTKETHFSFQINVKNALIWNMKECAPISFLFWGFETCLLSNSYKKYYKIQKDSRWNALDIRCPHS